jgi:hypothetical protein
MKDQNNNQSGLESEAIQKHLENITNAKKESHTPKEGVRTFATDIAGEVRDKNMSVIKIALAEQRRQEEYATIVKKSKKQKLLYLVLTAVFIIGGVWLVAESINQRDASVSTQPINQPQANSLIFSDDQTTLDVTNFSRTEFIQGFKQKTDFTSVKGVTNIIAITESGNTFRALSGAEFVDRIGVNHPESILDLLQYDYMMGVYNEEAQEQEVFAILRFDTFDTFVLRMREWESFLLEDLLSFFSISLSGEGSSIFSKEFSSEIILNKESRILRDANQGFVLGYTFLDRETVVITTSRETLNEIIDRYSVQAIQ